MRNRAGMGVAIFIAVLSLQAQLQAQWREGPRPGLFGERELGKPLAPRESRFGSGLQRGPSGNFLGRSTADRGTTFRERTRTEADLSSAVPPEAYPIPRPAGPSFAELQAQRMAEYQRQWQQVQPPVMPPRPQRYVLPAMPTQPGFPQPQPGVPGPTQPAPAQQDLQNSPDRWFRGPAVSTQPAQPDGAMPPAAVDQRYESPAGLGPAGSLGPSGLPGQGGLSRSYTATLGARITQTLGARAQSPISATLQGNIIILQGTVASAADRQYAERLAAREPGVARVVNGIRVAAGQ